MSRRDHSLPGDLQGLKPAVRSGLVAYLSPDAFLHIETGLVAGQVLDSESSMSAEKLLDLHAHMPAGSVHVEPDRIAPEPLAHLPQAIEKSRSIPTRGSHQPRSPQQGCDPPEDVQPMAMLAGGRDSKPLAPFSPSPTETWMQAEARFVLKDYGLSRSQFPEFFLTSSETSSLPWLVLEYTNNWHASAGIRADASNSGPAVPAALCHTGAPDAEPGSARPIGLGSTRTQMATSPGLPRVSFESLRSAVRVDLAGLSASKPQGLLRLLCASTDSGSDASGLRPRPPIPDADPPISAVEPQSLCLNGLLGFDEPQPINAPGLLRDAPTLDLDFA